MPRSVYYIKGRLVLKRFDENNRLAKQIIDLKFVEIRIIKSDGEISMAFTSKMKIIRYYGRKLVLPSDKIKKIVIDKIFNNDIQKEYIIDFGVGTLYWSK